MAFGDILKHVDFESLSDEAKRDLRKRLEQHQADLQAALDAVQRGLDQLGDQPGDPAEA